MTQDTEPRADRGHDETVRTEWEGEAARERATLAIAWRPTPGIGSRAPVTGERRLLAAILGDALNEILQFRARPSGVDRRRAERSWNEAREWIYSDDCLPFSFLTICDILGLDPDYLRSQVTRELRSGRHGSRSYGCRAAASNLRRVR